MSKASSGLYTGTIGARSVVKLGDAELSILANSPLPVSNPVTQAKRTGSALKSDPDHAFPDIVDNYAGYANKYSLRGGDGIMRNLYQIQGSLNGRKGIFEWIVDPRENKGVTHRRFIAGGEITGKPNQRPRK